MDDNVTVLNHVDEQELHGVAVDELSQKRMRQALDKALNQILPDAMRYARQSDNKTTVTVSLCYDPAKYPECEFSIEARCPIRTMKTTHRAKITDRNQLELFEEID